MSFLRYDQTISDWVIFAPSRAQRPHELRKGAAAATAAQLPVEKSCPFCPGNEGLTRARSTECRGRGVIRHGPYG